MVLLPFCPEFLESTTYLGHSPRATQLCDNKLSEGRKSFFKRGCTRVELQRRRGLPCPAVTESRVWVRVPAPPMGAAVLCGSSETRVCARSGVSGSATPRTAALQAPLSLGFSRQEPWSGLLPHNELSRRCARAAVNISEQAAGPDAAPRGHQAPSQRTR